MATLVKRSTWFVLATVWCVACSDGFSSSSRDKGSAMPPDDGAGMGSGDTGGSSATGGVGGGRAPSTGKLGGSTGLPTGGTATGGSAPATGGSAPATGGSDTATAGSAPATGGTGSAAGGSSNQGGSDNGGSMSSGATGGSGSEHAGMAGSAPQAGSGSGATPGQGGGSSSAGGTGGSSTAAGAPNASGGSALLGGCDNQLLANADFEAGPSSSWSEESTWPGIEIVVEKDNPDLAAEGVAPYGGNYLGWLGGIPDNEWDHELVILRQSITLPSTAATLTLTGRRYVKSVDDPSEPFDVAYLELETEAEELAWQAQAWTNQDTTDGWVPFTATTDVEPQYRGKKLTFVAYSNTDPGGQTSFFIDDLRLVAGCGR